MSPRVKGVLFYGGILLLLAGYGAYKHGLKSVLPSFGERSTFWIGQRPLKCYGNQVIHVRSEDVHTNEANFTIPLEATLTAMQHCHVIVEDAHLLAHEPIVASDHALVTVKNSELDCKGYGDCISASGHAKVELDHATIRASVGAHGCTTCDTAPNQDYGSGVALTDHATLVMNGGLIDGGGGDAVEAHDASHIELHDVTLHSRLVVDKWKHENGSAMELRDGVTAEVFGSTLDAAAPAFWSEGPVSVTFHETKLVGGWHAYHAKQLSGLPRDAYPGDGAK